MAGVTPTGFVRKTETEILDGMVSEARAKITPNMDDSPDTVFGGLISIVAAEAAEQWEAQEAVYNSYGPGASGNALDRNAALTGTRRKRPTFSTVTALVTGAGGPYPAGSIVATVEDDPSARFVSVEDIPVTAGPSFSVRMQADTSGPVRALGHTLKNLENPPAGVTAIDNPADADVGQGVEQDPDLRVRQREEASDPGATTTDALFGAISKLEGVDDHRVFTNRTLTPDSAGRPGKSVELIVLGGDDDEIAQTIWGNIAAGIESYSASGDSGAAIDEEGNEQIVPFSRPDDHRVWARITGVKDADSYAGDDAVKQTVADFTDGSITLVMSNGNEIEGTVEIGGILYRSKIAAAVLTVPGVLGVSMVEFSDDGIAWVDADTQLAAREYLGFSGSRGIQFADVTVVIT